MKSFKRYLKEDWWDDLGAEGQEAYINEHPNSAKAKSVKAQKTYNNEKENNNFSDADMKYIEKHPQSEKALRYKFYNNNKELSYKDKHNIIMKINDKDILEKLANDNDVKVRMEVAYKVPENIKSKLANDNDVKVRVSVADSTSNPELLKELSKDKKVSVRKKVITNPNTPIETLEDIAENDYDETEMEELVYRVTNDSIQSFKKRAEEMPYDDYKSGKDIENEIDKLGYRKLFNILKDRGWEPNIKGHYKFKREHPSEFSDWGLRGEPRIFVKRDSTKDKTKPGSKEERIKNAKLKLLDPNLDSKEIEDIFNDEKIKDNFGSVVFYDIKNKVPVENLQKMLKSPNIERFTKYLINDRLKDKK